MAMIADLIAQMPFLPLICLFLAVLICWGFN